MAQTVGNNRTLAQNVDEWTIGACLILLVTIGAWFRLLNEWEIGAWLELLVTIGAWLGLLMGGK